LLGVARLLDWHRRAPKSEKGKIDRPPTSGS
jgi:hypothetical protein